MHKKIIFIFMMFVMTFGLFACQEDITLSIDDLSVTLKEGETYQIDAISNDELINFESSDETIVTVSDSGLIEAMGVGSATITASSSKNDEISVDIAITVEPNITIDIEEEAYTIFVGDQQAIDYTSNGDVAFESNDTSIITVDETGNVTALLDGEAIVTITSTVDDTVSKDVTITVRKVISLEVATTSYELWVGKTESIDYTSNDDVRFDIEDDSIIRISSNGTITGLKNGTTSVDIVSTYDETVKETINVRVFNEAETLLILGQPMVNLNSTFTLIAEVGPNDAYQYVSWESSDESVATVNEEGLLTALASGTVTITATSLFDNTLTDTFDVEVVNYLVVDETKVASDTLNYMDMTFEFGQDLFANIQDAIDVATENVTIYVFAGTYEDEVNINVDHISIEGLTDSIISGEVVVSANHVHISKLGFTGAATFTNAHAIDNLMFNENTIEEITGVTAFMHLNGISDLEIKDNIFLNISGHAIVVENYLSGLINIYNNTITNADTAIKVVAVEDYDLETQVHIERNTINLINTGIEVQTISSIDIEDYVRFNEITNYTNLAAKANDNHKVDFTLNYWGNETPIYTDFEGITTHDLRGYYSDPTNIVSETAYNPLVPLVIIPESNYLLLEVGDIYSIDFEVLPIGADSDKVRFITSDPDKLQFESYGVVKSLESGFSDVTLRLSTDFSINSVMNIEVTTDPGIEITPSTTTQNLIVGDTLELETRVFPFQIKDSIVLYESLNPDVATINQLGEISSHSAGVVTFVVKLENDETVTNEFTIEFHTSLDQGNLLDILTTGQIIYTTPHEWVVYGVTHNYLDFKYESVSRYYFDELEINTSKMIPIGVNRPGIKKPNHMGTDYNDENVYYVVVHETANTSAGQGALAHANYLYNGAINSNVYVSWHYTMDDKALYQHVPLDEIAYHAGDGSTLAGTTWTNNFGNEYIGGGNRNGIGIETSVAEDGDNYRVWQRTAKLSAQLLIDFNLPVDHMKYHNHFSGKMCPQSMLRGGLTPLFEEMVAFEYLIESTYGDADIQMVSHNPEYVDHTGRVINMPDRAMTVSYTITVDLDGVQTSRTFYSYLPGTMH